MLQQRTAATAATAAEKAREWRALTSYWKRADKAGAWVGIGDVEWMDGRKNATRTGIHVGGRMGGGANAKVGGRAHAKLSTRLTHNPRMPHTPQKTAGYVSGKLGPYPQG